MMQALSAAARSVGQSAGLACNAEQRSAAFWQLRAQEEAAGRQSASERVVELEAHLAQARQAHTRLSQLYHSAELRLSAAQEALSVEKGETARLQVTVEGLRAQLGSEASSKQQLAHDLDLQRTAAREYRAKADAELSGRDAAEALVLRLSKSLAETRDELSECSAQRAVCAQGLTGCQHHRQKAEQRAEHLAAERHYACVGWLSDVASRLRARWSFSATDPHGLIAPSTTTNYHP